MNHSACAQAPSSLSATCSSSCKCFANHVQVKTLKSGEIDYDHFREVLVTNRARPAIVNVNCGTTVKGAVDDLDRVLQILRDCGYNEDRFYIHVDGALFGMMVSIHHQINPLHGRIRTDWNR